MGLNRNTLWSEICAIFEVDDKNKKATKNTTNLQNDLLNTYTNVYNENPTIKDGDKTFTFQDRMNQVGSHIGVNNQGNQQNTANNVQAQRNEIGDKQFVIDFVDKMLEAAEELKKYVKPNGSVNPKLMYAHNIDQYGNGNIQNDINADAGYLMKMKDIIDLLSLSFLYYNPYQKDNDSGEQLPITQTAYYKNTPKTYRTLALGALKKNADKTIGGKNVDINQAYSSEMLDYSELKDYIVNYLTDSYYIKKLQLDGTRWHNKSGTGYKDIYKPKDKDDFYEKHKELVENDYFKALADKIFKNVYGINLDVPDSAFTYGNNKLPNDTLVINFTSAHRCPAWNDCLVRNACYARSSEHGYKDLFAKNKNINMMWEGSKYDQRIMDALKAVIRSYLINYDKVGPLFTIAPAKNQRYIDNQNVLQNASTDNEYSMVNEAVTKYDEDILSIIKSHEGFNRLSSEQLAIIKNPEYEIIRAKYIRLNEEGDFIGQWLIDAIDEFAGELSKIGVKVAAYTCRNLNYNGIRNIILNASKYDIGTNGDGTISNAIARRFYAVPEDFYNSLDETYAPNSAAVQYDEEGNPVNEPVMPTLVEENGERRIVPYPQPVYADEGGLQRNESYYYYKCPCGRGKKQKKGEEKTMVNTRFNTVNVDTGVIGKSGIDCYDCRVCYQPKSELSNMPIVVYVQVHSTEKDLFNYKQQKDTGYSKSYQQNRQSLNLNEDDSQNNVDEREVEAFQQITNNAIQSVQEHLNNLGNLREWKVKNDFNTLLERINNVEF